MFPEMSSASGTFLAAAGPFLVFSGPETILWQSLSGFFILSKTFLNSNGSSVSNS